LPRRCRVLIVCGSGIATSTMVYMQVGELLKRHGIDAELVRIATQAAKTASADADLIVATTQVPDGKVPVISGIPFLTGIGVEAAEQEIISRLRETKHKDLLGGME
jgi:PTS system galactitol-specific IIB component